ncbi:MAG: hypothetical protein MZW92_65145 [Comamonadaceae bacterium]|nr:hypothetical protein [Comamonadaceae bacterium]
MRVISAGLTRRPREAVSGGGARRRWVRASAVLWLRRRRGGRAPRG